MATSVPPGLARLLDDPDVRRLLALLPGARLVGGCVRDALLGLPATDIDAATPLPPERVAAALAAAGVATYPTGLAHGTLTARLGGRPRSPRYGVTC